MAEGQNELQIVLSLIDNASAQLKKITGDIKKDTQEITKVSDKASKSLGEGMKEAGKGLKEFRREIYIATAAIAAATVVSKAWAENNIQARESLDSIGVSINRVMGSLGSILTPIIGLIEKALTGIASILELSAKGWAGIWGLFTGGMEKAMKEMDKFTAGLAQRGNLKEMNDQMKLMTDELNRMNLMFMTGKISAEQYYAAISSNTVATYQNMQMQMQLMQQMAAQENLMRNQALMDYKADVEAKMGLLKTLESYHHTVYSSMMNFANMFIQQFSTGMTTALTSIIMGTKKASEAFKEFGIALVTAIVQFVIQYGIQMLIAMALSKIVMASTVAQAGAIAAAWLPAAIFASIATMGEASAAGAAGFAVATGASLTLGAAAIAAGMATGGAGGGFAEGGRPPVGRASVVGEEGPELFIPDTAGTIIPNNRIDRFSGYEPSITINLTAIINHKLDVAEIAEELGIEIARQRSYSRKF